MDTGANKNYISPRHVKPENCKIETGIQVTNIRGRHKIEKSASFDVFQIKKRVKFYVFDFHDFFDGLIEYRNGRKRSLDFFTDTQTRTRIRSFNWSVYWTELGTLSFCWSGMLLLLIFQDETTRNA